MTDLLSLAERVERAEGPDRELDREIAQAINEPPLYKVRGSISATWPDYTRSIDAAMTLVPERWGNVGTYPWIAKQKQDRWQAGVSAPGSEKRPPVCYAATPALALTAAALKARARIKETSHGE